MVGVLLCALGKGGSEFTGGWACFQMHGLNLAHVRSETWFRSLIFLHLPQRQLSLLAHYQPSRWLLRCEPRHADLKDDVKMMFLCKWT